MQTDYLGLNDDGHEVIRTVVLNEDGSSGYESYYTCDGGTWYLIEQTRLNAAQLYEANAWRRQYDNIKNIVEISKPAVMGTRGSGKSNALMQAYGAAAHQRRGYQVQIFDNLDFSNLEIRAAGMAVLDSAGTERVNMGSTRKNRHHKAKPQPNRGPLPRKEWK